MSQITDFYPSWQGCAAFGNNTTRLRSDIPIIFRPTDLSGCAMWLDANDANTVTFNELLQVSSWSNKGYLGGQFDISGTSIVEFGSAQINGLNTVSFTENAYMVGTFALNFQARSVFFVAREKVTPLSVANPWLSSDASNGMETFSLRNGVTTYFIGKHPSPIPTLAFETTTDYIQSPLLVEFLNDTDLSGNWFGLNGIQYPAIYEVVASGYNTGSIVYYLGGYFSGTTVASSQDMAEVIIYNRALEESERQTVEAYLLAKWAIPEPPPPPPGPAPFNPTDISGLQIWLDPNQPLTVQTVGSTVFTFTNVGATAFDLLSNQGETLLFQDPVANFKNVLSFSNTADLYTEVALNYQDRTQFMVFRTFDDFSTLAYPFLNFWNTGTNSGMQTGIAYDSNIPMHFMAMCQQGQNCPVGAPIGATLSTGVYHLAVFKNVALDYTQNAGYFDGGSNINTSTDVGNLFIRTSIPYTFGWSNTNAPTQNIAEMLEYDKPLTLQQISTVSSYLATKYALSSLQAYS